MTGVWCEDQLNRRYHNTVSVQLSLHDDCLSGEGNKNQRGDNSAKNTFEHHENFLRRECLLKGNSVHPVHEYEP